ncbi:transposase [Flavobacterium limicola]|nr:transposase [Flavobacterium limicola]
MYNESLSNHFNYFDKRSTNASAESFNAKIKAFRLQFRGALITLRFSFLG